MYSIRVNFIKIFSINSSPGRGNTNTQPAQNSVRYLQFHLNAHLKKIVMKSIVFTSVLFFLALSVYAQTEKMVSSNEQEIKKLSHDWMIATMNRDEKTLNQIVSAEFKLGGTDMNKPDIPREIWMKNTMENLTIDSIHYLNMQVDVIDNVAIVRSTFYWSVSYSDLRAKKDTVDLVDTWLKRDEGWQVVSRLVVDK